MIAGVWGSLLLLCAVQARDILPKPALPVPGLGTFGMVVDLELAHLNKVQIATMWVSSLLG